MLMRCVRRRFSGCHRYTSVRLARTITTSTARYASSTAPEAATFAIARTRNIGIIAHIDAGKTTTTERMLYYSGFTRRIGDVDEGSTVTDFLPAERARGITIQSAAISFAWPPNTSNPPNFDEKIPDGIPRSQIPHNINLIDTPGHADFTFEVLRSLRVLDGAVCILDGVAGVEAQTEKVWSQANAYAIPRIIFVNKLDRDGAAFGRTVREIGARLGCWPAVCGVPWFDREGALKGVGDAVQLRGLKYRSGGDGKDIDVLDLTSLANEDSELAEEVKRARIALVELLSEHDDEMVEHYLEADEDHLAITPQQITRSLRKCALQSPQLVVPVFAGASFRNVGVQPLLDAVVDLLPSPEERPDSTISLDASTQGGLQSLLSGELKIPEQTDLAASKAKRLAKKGKPELGLKALEACALAFKVVADAKRGVLVYVRVYSGSLERGSVGLWNANLQQYERAPRLLKMFANDAVEIPSIAAGQIGVIPGLKLTRTGDTLIQYAGAAKTGPPRPFNSMQLKPINVPPPVFFVSVEPNSLSEERAIKEALDILLREDPSLHVSLDEESGQTHLAGMGELHLEIARDRLITDFKAKARIGKIEIGYREMLSTGSGEVTEIVDRDVEGTASKAGCTARLEPRSEAEAVQNDDHFFEADLDDNNSLIISAPSLNRDGLPKEEETPGIPEHLTAETVILAIQNGVKAGLGRGPAHRYAMHSTQVTIHLDPAQHLFANTTTSAISAAVRQAVSRALSESCQASETVMMEPVMLVTISVDEESMGSVVHDLSSARGGSVISLGSAMDEESVSASEGATIDVKKIYAPADAFAGGHAVQDDASIVNAHSSKQILARVPLKEMVGYLKHLRSLTAGRGTFTMTVDRFEKMSGQRQKAVLNALRGDYDY